MKTKSILATLLLLIAGLQTMWGQMFVIYKSDGQAIECNITELDSIVFISNEPISIPSYLACPDDNHPHAIDLGLPSGTKWACCNIGATTPDGYGSYYAWGETIEKSNCSLDTYAYVNVDNEGHKNITHIGFDIAGTSYDVAHVRMGTPWHMPTIEQMNELVNNCFQRGTQKNGINGVLVTGQNGGQVFFPAAGELNVDNLCLVGNCGYYWSSSLDQNTFSIYGNDRVCAMDINLFYGSYVLGVGTTFYRCYGHSVRAVCP